MLDLQNCLERLDLENYDECRELKSPFKKKHRLILIRAAKSVNKVHDLKFQAQSVEEKEAWIKALCDGISRAKNKVFDEVKVDEGSNLEHVTRSRPKGNRNRRPPTRIHMKEVADVSSDGILRLDLDFENAVMPNGTHHPSVDATKKQKDDNGPTPASKTGEEKPCAPIAEEEEDDPQPEPEVSHKKKVIMPPMAPVKEAKPSPAPEDKPNTDESLEKKVLKPPMPPSKEVKPCASSAKEGTEEGKPDNSSESSPDATKKEGPPPAPPNKPTSSGSMGNLAEASQSSRPPTPPSKEKKPSIHSVEPDQQANYDNEKIRKDDSSNKEIDDPGQMISKEAPPSVKVDELVEAVVSEDESEMPDNESQKSTELQRNNPLLTCKKNPGKPAETDMQSIETSSDEIHPKGGPLSTTTDASTSSPQEEVVPSWTCPLNDSITDSLSPSPELHHFSEEKKKNVEEKSVDSGQHSDEESEGSVSEDTPALSRGTHPTLDSVDASEDKIQVSVHLKPVKDAIKPQVSPKSRPDIPLKPSAKAKSASIGDLLSNTKVYIQGTQSARASTGSVEGPSDNVLKLEAEVALQMEKTSKLLSRTSKVQKGGVGEGAPGDLLAEAMEKLKKADDVLREVKKLKLAKNPNNRKSW
ncbi:uncharacterized protein plekho2 isoform 2-T2 [Pholidichthys leucotaenia]